MQCVDALKKINALTALITMHQQGKIVNSSFPGCYKHEI